MTPGTQGKPLHYVGWLVGERLVRGLVTVAALAAVARHLQPAGFGVLNFAFAMVGLAVPIAQMGLDIVLVRELVRDPGRTGPLLGTAFCLRLAGGVVCAVLLLIACRFSSTLASARVAIAPMSLMLIVQAGEVVDCWFRSRVLSRAVVLIRGGIIILGAGVKFVFVAVGAGVAAFAWIYTAEAAAFAVGLMVASRVSSSRAPAWSFDRDAARVLMRNGWGFALAGLVAGLSVRVDQIAIAGSLGDAAAGLYYGALRLIEPATFVASVTAASLFPALAGTREHPLLHAKLETVFGVVSALAWITALGTSLVAPLLISTLLGSAYHNAWPVLVIQGWATLFAFSGLVRANYLALREAPASQAAAAATALVVQVLLNIFLIPRFGISGAALAFLLAQLFGALVVPLFLPTLRPCLVPQLRGLIAPWQPSQWREFLKVTQG